MRLQDKASTFNGPLHVVRHLVKTEGLIGGLYTGMESTFWRCVIGDRSLTPKLVVSANG